MTVISLPVTPAAVMTLVNPADESPGKREAEGARQNNAPIPSMAGSSSGLTCTSGAAEAAPTGTDASPPSSPASCSGAFRLMLGVNFTAAALPLPFFFFLRFAAAAAAAVAAAEVVVAVAAAASSSSSPSSPSPYKPSSSKTRPADPPATLRWYRALPLSAAAAVSAAPLYAPVV